MSSLLVAMAITLAAVGSTQSAAKDVEHAVREIQSAFDKGDVATVKARMTEDHVTVLTYARFSNAASQLAVLSDFQFSGYAIDGLGVKLLSDDAALVTYTATIKGAYKGREVPSPVHVSQVWIKRHAKWLQAAYVETPAE